MTKEKISETKQSIPCLIIVISKLIYSINNEINNISDMKAYNSFQKYMTYIIHDYISDLSEKDIKNIDNIENINKFFYKTFIKPINNKKINFNDNDLVVRSFFTKYGIIHYKQLLKDINDILIKKDYILRVSDIEWCNYIYYSNLCKLKKKDKMNINKNELNNAFRVIYNISCKS